MQHRLIISYVTLLLLDFSATSCEMFQDNYDSIKKGPIPSIRSFEYPGFGNVKWVQESVKNDLESTQRNTFIVQGQDSINSLTFKMQAFDSKSQLFSNLIYTKIITFSTGVEGRDTVEISSDTFLNQNFSTLALLQVNHQSGQKLSGDYNGEFRFFKDGELYNGGFATGFIDYLGHVILLFDSKSPFASIEGNILSDSTYFISFYDIQATRRDSAISKVKTDTSSVLNVHVSIHATPEIDSVILYMTRHNLKYSK